MRLIERESQLAALHQYADEASQGQGRLVLISGEAGVGKSVLLEEFAQDLKDARWLWAGCDGLFTRRCSQLHRCSRPSWSATVPLHAWIWKDNPAGTFEMWNPSVHCDET